MSDALQQASELLAGRSRIMAFTGAGISTESGIPDFRGPGGVWSKVDPSEFTYQKYVSNPETRKRSWRMRDGSGVLDAKPNAAHQGLVDIWRAGRLGGCVTQNIDGLHRAAGLPADQVVELHGNAHRARCLDCGDTTRTTVVLARVAEGDDDPHCRDCGGIIKAAVISFGEAMPVNEMERAFEFADAADAVISVGSTLSVYPAADVPLHAAARGVPYVIVNRGPTEHDALATVKVEAAAGATLLHLAAAIVAAGG